MNRIGTRMVGKFRSLVLVRFGAGCFFVSLVSPHPRKEMKSEDCRMMNEGTRESTPVAPSRPLGRPSTGLCLGQIPSAGSQPTEVPGPFPVRGGEGIAFGRWVEGR